MKVSRNWSNDSKHTHILHQEAKHEKIKHMEVKPGHYKHYKNKDYTVLYTCNHSETLEKMVVYQALYGEKEIWVRPLSMFTETVEVNGRTQKRFQKQEEKNNSLTSIILGIFATLLVTCGITLLIAHNWEALSRPVRSIISVAPIVLSIAINLGYLLRNTSLSITKKEVLSLSWMASIGISIALVSQTYHIPGHFEQFLFTWMLLSLPILYLHRSLSVLISYILGATIWILYSQGITALANPIFYILLLLAAAPRLYAVLKSNFQTPAPYILLWTTLPMLTLGLPFTLSYAANQIWIPIFGAFASLLYLLSRYLPKRKELLKKPLSIIGGIQIGILALILSFKEVWPHFFKQTHPIEFKSVLTHFPNMIVDYTVLILVAASMLYLFYTTLKKSDLKENAVLGSFGLLCLISYSIASLIPHPTLIANFYILFNLYIFSVGIIRLALGIPQLDYLKVNTGIALIASIFLVRFFDPTLSFTIRGIVFILIGFGFWFANHKIAKSRKAADV